MCFVIWVRKDKFELVQDRLQKHKYDKLVAKLSKFAPVRSSPPVYEQQDLVIKIHQNPIRASKRPDSLLLPSYMGYRSGKKRQRVEEDGKLDEFEEAVTL